MLHIQIDEKNGVAILSPEAKLSEADFKNAANVIDPYIEQHGKLNGLIISAQFFPGWESFSGLASHLSFVKDHHEKIKRVALVTNSPLGSLAENLASHFVSAKIMAFKYSEIDSARLWVLESSGT